MKKKTKGKKISYIRGCLPQFENITTTANAASINIFHQLKTKKKNPK